MKGTATHGKQAGADTANAAAGFAMFGTVAIALGAVLIAFVLIRRRRRAAACAAADAPASVPVELTDTRSRSLTERTALSSVPGSCVGTHVER